MYVRVINVYWSVAHSEIHHQERKGDAPRLLPLRMNIGFLRNVNGGPLIIRLNIFISPPGNTEVLSRCFPTCHVRTPIIIIVCHYSLVRESICVCLRGWFFEWNKIDYLASGIFMSVVDESMILPDFDPCYKASKQTVGFIAHINRSPWITFVPALISSC